MHFLAESSIYGHPGVCCGSFPRLRQPPRRIARAGRPSCVGLHLAWQGQRCLASSCAAQQPYTLHATALTSAFAWPASQLSDGSCREKADDTLFLFQGFEPLFLSLATAFGESLGQLGRSAIWAERPAIVEGAFPPVPPQDPQVNRKAGVCYKQFPVFIFHHAVSTLKKPISILVD